MTVSTQNSRKAILGHSRTHRYRLNTSDTMMITPVTKESGWKYQLRIGLEDTCAHAARRNSAPPELEQLNLILQRHNATLCCQFDAFAAYCAEAERNGIERYPLYAWTKATIGNPAKKAKYLKSFAIHVDGEEVYARHRTDALEDDLKPLVGAGVVVSLAKYDTDPENNPQPPRKYRT